MIFAIFFGFVFFLMALHIYFGLTDGNYREDCSKQAFYIGHFVKQEKAGNE